MKQARTGQPDAPAGTAHSTDADSGLPHVPVLLAEVIEALSPANGGVYVDGTFGAGGYSRAILDAADCRVIALDRDPTAIAGAGPILAAYRERLALIETAFGDMEAVVCARLGTVPDGPCVNGVVLDIGVSSMQLDRAERGFSFMADGPLDMRMGASGPTVADLIARAEESQLADVIFHLGEERQARRISRAIVAERAKAPIDTTHKLAHLVARVVGRSKGDDRHPATRTFQALRIWVNDELGELARALSAAERIIRPGGRLVVVTFHSLEDRIVKRFLARRSHPEPHGSRHLPPTVAASSKPSFELVNRRPLSPGDAEIVANPRARSAKLRAALRTHAPAWMPESPAELGLPAV